MIKRALISVFYKDGILDMAKFLSKRGVEIISTGGTYRYLSSNGIKVTEVSDVTGFDEILDGRVKTLHPKIHGGILAKRNNPLHMKTIKDKGIEPIDMIIVNLYPFFEKVNENISFDDKIEFIDIGGPTMLRAAAKNFMDVVVICDKNDYKEVMSQIEDKGDVDYDTKKHLAGKVFNLTSAYDASISQFLLSDSEYNNYYNASYEKKTDLRYGENPHQSAAFYVDTKKCGAMSNIEQLNGKELSFNNIKDMDAAWRIVNEFDETACCALKHNTPCGVAIGDTAHAAYIKAYNCDPVSIFGGIVSFNKKVDLKTAEELKKTFLEVVIAPDFDEDAINLLKTKKNLRIIKCTEKPSNTHEVVSVDGGLLVQSTDKKMFGEYNYVTEKRPDETELKNMEFGMKAAKYVKSNAIVVVRDMSAIGIGGGETNRIWAACEALERAEEKVVEVENQKSLNDAVLVSDAFFPFSDIVETANKYGIKAIMQPGGSIRDQESIDACNKYGISMVFTGIRHFRH